MFNSYRTRMSLYGNNVNEAMLRMSNEIKSMVFDGTVTYKRVKVDNQYYDARVMRSIDATVGSASSNFVIQFRDDKKFPVGTYIWIPDENGVEEIWMLVSDKEDAIFPKNCILKCTYRLRWLHNYKLIEYPVAIRTKNSYTDGVRQTEDFNLLDNQSAFWIPFNEDSAEITYNMRFLISNNPKHPQAYIVSKINDVLRPGIISVMLIQDQLGEYDDGTIMCADYDVMRWKCNITVENAGKELHLKPQDSYKLQVSGAINEMVVDGTYFTFASGDKDVVTIDQNGKITAVGVGEANILIQLGNTQHTIHAVVSNTEVIQKDTIDIIDPDGDYVLRLRFEKELEVALYRNGIKESHPQFHCEILEGADFTTYQIKDNIIILTASPSLSNVGKTIKLKVSTDDGIENTQTIIVKGVI